MPIAGAESVRIADGPRVRATDGCVCGWSVADAWAHMVWTGPERSQGSTQGSAEAWGEAGRGLRWRLMGSRARGSCACDCALVRLLFGQCLLLDSVCSAKVSTQQQATQQQAPATVSNGANRVEQTRPELAWMLCAGGMG